MRVLILGMNYAPESTGIAPYTTEFAEYLAEAGHDVHVITAPPHFPQWRVWDDYRGRGKRSQRINGVSIHRTYAYVPSQPRKVLNRVLYDSVFSISVLIRAVFLKRSDIVFAVSPPVQLGLTGWLVAKRNGAPLFFHIKDIASRALVGAGMATDSSLVSRLARKVEDAAHGCADSIGVICDAFEQYLRCAGVPSEKIVFFPDYIDTDTLQPSSRVGPFRKKHGVGEQEFVVMYSGGIAQKQGLETLADAAAQSPDLRFIIIGEGPAKTDLERKIAKDGLTNITMMPLQPKSGLAEQLSAADALVLTQKQNVTDAVFPSKLLTYMACERPVVVAAATNSETAIFVNKHRVGLVAPPEDPAALAYTLRRLAADPELAAELARNGRKTVMSIFEKRVVLTRMAGALAGGQFASAR